MLVHRTDGEDDAARSRDYRLEDGIPLVRAATGGGRRARSAVQQRASVLRCGDGKLLIESVGENRTE